MTILQRSTFQGTAHQDVRPGAYTKTATVEGIVKDQAYLYERITNIAVPDAASASATGHDHSGDGDGALIRVPYCQQPLGISLAARTSAPIGSGPIDYAAFSPFVWTPFYAQAGVSKIMAVLWVNRDAENARTSFRAVCFDGSLNRIGDWVTPKTELTYPWLKPPVDGLHALVFVTDCDEGLYNTVRIDAWDGLWDESVPANERGQKLEANRFVHSMCISPEIRQPNADLLQYGAPTSTTNALSLPSSLTSFDSALISDDVGISGYHLVSINQNDGVLQELATDKPAGAEAGATLEGHNHGDAASIGAGTGAEIGRTLGAWFYGTVRPPPEDGTSSSHYVFADVIGNPPTVRFANVWEGGSSAITITTAASTNWTTVAKHLVRIPETIAANVSTGTGKLVGVAFVWFDATKATRLDLRMSLGDENDANYGATASDFTTVSATRDLLYCIRIPATSTPAGGQICTLKVEMKNTTSQNEASFLYGTALVYQP
jgi:hypothetical protein